MRDCPDGAIRDALPLYVSGRLDDVGQARVEAHLLGCADCAAEVELLRATLRAFEVKPLDAATIAAKIPAARVTRRARPFHSQPLWRVAAAITVMIAGTATLMVVRQPTLVPGIDSVAVSLGVDSGGDTRVAASARATSTMSFGNNLSDLTDAQLEALLASLERLDGTVSADPQALVPPIVPDTSAGRIP